MSFFRLRRIGNLSEKPEGLSASADPLRLGGQAAMTESDNDVALLMNSLVSVMLNLIQHLMEKVMRPCSPRRLLGDPPEAGIRLSAENKFRVTNIAVLFNKHYSMKTFKMCIARYDFTIFLQCCCINNGISHWK